MAKMTHVLHVEMDLNKPVEELTQVISSVLSAHPHNQKEILAALDLRSEMRVQRLRFKNRKINRKSLNRAGNISLTERRGFQLTDTTISEVNGVVEETTKVLMGIQVQLARMEKTLEGVPAMAATLRLHGIWRAKLCNPPNRPITGSIRLRMRRHGCGELLLQH